ncbi:putative toxin-antitoxin system antitoxin component, TIGR02293 family [Chitinophaga rupis]|uniref:Putative toxin-antitoxin system antitoxin component, TIGR02293 family n=1 Tax=Chitinophaga rupis TaxID=573321 RepID=A0A1H7QPK7_9BACT|nr:antitoxin Xre-like helix-turn-helix domain-containing protein [Chitinophaga rupis]SEL49852.1 putative toxin-antitoxin system antitoxin component, TIGR02293 family [Chitinophaga rupis]
MAKAMKASSTTHTKMPPVASIKESGEGALPATDVSRIQQAFQDIDLRNNYQLVTAALSGVYADTFIKFVDLANISRNELAAAMNISTKTIKNKLADKEPLDPNQGEHLLKIISLFELGEKIFGGLEPFKRWLEKPFFGKPQKPEDFLKTTGGVELIMDELKRLAYGDVI